MRSNRRMPRWISSSRICRLIAPWVRLSSPAARVKLPCCAAATNDVSSPIDGISPRFNARILPMCRRQATRSECYAAGPKQSTVFANSNSQLPAIIPDQRDIRRPIARSAGGLLLCHLRFVKLLGAQASRTVAEPLPILLESRTLFDHSKHHAEAELRADIEIGGGETVAGEIISPRHGVFERIEDQRDISVAHHPLALRRHDDAERLVARR